MKTIITIQHTESVHHTNGMVGSVNDWPLSEKGVLQAENIGKNLAKELSAEYKIYSSDLARAAQTAEIVGKYIGSKPNFFVELRERDLGEAVGHSIRWLKEHMEKPEKTVTQKADKPEQDRRNKSVSSSLSKKPENTRQSKMTSPTWKPVWKKWRKLWENADPIS